MELKNTSAIVTGGASGLGEATARALSARGVKVVLADLNDERGAALAKEIGVKLGAIAAINLVKLFDRRDRGVIKSEGDNR